MQFFRHQETRHFATALLLLPLLVFSFFSVGTMPDFSKQGMEIVICSGDGLKTIVVPGSEQNKHEGQDCSWSAYFHMADTGSGFVPVLPACHANGGHVHLIQDHAQRVCKRRTRLPRAPPLPV